MRRAVEVAARLAIHPPHHVTPALTFAAVLPFELPSAEAMGTRKPLLAVLGHGFLLESGPGRRPYPRPPPTAGYERNRSAEDPTTAWPLRSPTTRVQAADAEEREPRRGPPQGQGGPSQDVTRTCSGDR
jgi:hypothetical protein